MYIASDTELDLHYLDAGAIVNAGLNKACDECCPDQSFMVLFLKMLS